MNRMRILSNIAINCAKSHPIIGDKNVVKCYQINNTFINSIAVKNAFKPLIMNRLMSSAINEEVVEEVKPDLNLKGYQKSKRQDPDRDRRVAVEPEVSIRYIRSKAYRETYANHMVWQLFRRNFKGQFSPSAQRRNCVEEGFVKSSNPCAICRDKYLVFHYSNIELLNQFISPHTGYVYPNTYLCLCLAQYEKLLVAITLAKDYGLINFDIPFREYDYQQYYPHLINSPRNED